MSDVVFKLVADPTMFIQGVRVADNSQAELNKSVDKFGKDSKKAYDDAAKGPESYGKKTDEVVTKTQSLKSKLRELKAELADATDPEDIIRLSKEAGKLADQIGDASDAAAVFATDSPFEAIGNSIGSVGSKLRNLDFKGAADQSKLLVAATKSLTFKEAIGGVKDLGTTLVNMGKSLLMNPIFLLGAAITLIVTNFDALKNAGGLVGEIFGGIGDAISFVVDNGKELLQVIGLIGEAKQTLEDFEKINNSIIVSIGNKYDMEIAKAKASGKEIVKLEKEKQQEIIKQLDVIQARLVSDHRKGLLDDDKYNEKIIENSRERQAAEIAIMNSETEARKEALAKRQKAEEDWNNALMDLFKRAQAAELESLTGQAKIDKQKEISDAELKNLQATILKKQILAGKGNEFSATQLEQFKQLKLAIDRKYNVDSIALELQLIQEKSALRLKDAQNSKQSLDFKQKAFDLETQMQLEQVEAMRKPKGMTDADFEKTKQIAVLEIKKKAAQDSLNIRLAEMDAETKILTTQAQNEIDILRAKGDAASLAEADRLTGTINSITANNEKAKQVVIAQNNNLITDIDKQIGDLNRSLQAFHINWADIFGVSESEMKVIEQNLMKIASIATKAANDFLNSQDNLLKKELDVIEAKKKANESDISNLETQLNKQKDLKEAGYANNFDVLQRELEDKRANQAQQLEDEKKLKLEQEKIAKERMLLQQAQQYSSLVTAIAEVYASVASSGPIGIAIGAVTIAAMLASFAYAQGQASAAINASDSSFAEGGYTGDGGKYEEAGTVHKGEFVNTKETTKKYRTLLEGMHTDDNAKIELGLHKLLKNTGVSLPDITKDINNSKNNLRTAELRTIFKQDNSKLSKEVVAIKESLALLVKQGAEDIQLMPNGDRMIRKGSVTRIIKKNG